MVENDIKEYLKPAGVAFKNTMFKDYKIFSSLSIWVFPFLLSIIGCKGKEENRSFPPVKNLQEFKQTDFIPTLENPLTEKKNYIYCVSILFAWEEIKKEINSPFQIDSSFKHLILLNQSDAHINTLNNDEYETTINIEHRNISAKAYFKKTLPFIYKLNSYEGKLEFNATNVSSFGMTGFNSDNSIAFNILYYKNDSNFIIKIFPEDDRHEIILYMSSNDSAQNTLMGKLNYFNEQIYIGNNERNDENNTWKYLLGIKDEIIIPKLKFNIETNYHSIENKSFSANNQVFMVNKAYQRTAFLIDEYGAIIESEAETDVKSEPPVIETPHPKKMHFNKPFLLILKRTDCKYPYFAMWTDNTELMEKE